ncbi:STAS domain-containing protein [Streptomyces galbus]|uniref:STAS domain-containing protein n=1 Tax=Streptomyces galbus TaxID=33898 RepID=UPI00144A65C4|nr:STAS domain-containing protein [Streptomyces galbus]
MRQSRGYEEAKTVLQLIGRQDDLVIAALEEEIDLFTSDEVRTAGERLLDDGGRVLVLDTSSLTYIDSSGITALLALYRRLEQQQGALIMAIPDEHLRRRMSILGLDDVITIKTSLHYALAQARAIDAGAMPHLRTAHAEAETV